MQHNNAYRKLHLKQSSAVLVGLGRASWCALRPSRCEPAFGSGVEQHDFARHGAMALATPYNSCGLQYKVYQIGHPLTSGPYGDVHNTAFQQLGVPVCYEPCEVPPVNFHRVMSGLLRDTSCLGAKLLPPYKQTALAYCQEVSATAQGISAVNTLVRRPSGLIYGHNTDVAAFIQCLKEQNVKRVRTAIILGAGGAARVALTGLRDLACARYLIGFRQPRRPSELSSQFKGIRRQMSFFPLQEMVEFFAWADKAQRLNSAFETALQNDNGDEERDESEESKEQGNDGPKKWNLLVNATPVGLSPGSEDDSLVTSVAFLRCVDRVFDMAPAHGETKLVQLAKSAGLPFVEGRNLFLKQAELSRELWLKEYARHLGQLAPDKGERNVVKVQLGQRRHPG
jgi:shikimate 5-dehydrogenase